MTLESATRGTVTIMFTDLEASTRLAARKGDLAARDVVETYRAVVLSQLRNHSGRQVQTIGDGVLATFASARDALLCAVAIQEAVAVHNAGCIDRQFRVRIGLNAGDALIFDGADVFGSTVNAAARVTDRAAGGEIVASEIVRLLAGPSPDLQFEPRGNFKLKGFDGRWRLYRVTTGRDEPATKRLPRRAVPSPSGPFIGRGAELERTRQLIEDVAIGSFRAGLIEGEAGIGKSRLLAEALAVAAERGFAVFYGRADEVDTGRPFAALIDAFGADLSPDDADRADLARLIYREHDQESSSGLSLHVTENVIEFIESAASKSPVTVAIEDLHWADTSTLRLLAQIARRLRHLPIAMLATVRPHPRPLELLRLLDVLIRDGATVIQVAALSDDEVERLVRKLIGLPAGPGLLRAVGGAAGNPLFIGEVIAALEAEGAIARRDTDADAEGVTLPRGLRLTVLRRIGTLGVETLEALRVASLLGSSFAVDDLAVVLGVSLPQLLGVLRPALDAGFIGQQQDKLSFRHDLIREAVYEDFVVPLRHSLHLHVAKALANSNAPADRVASHLILASEHLDRSAIELILALAPSLRAAPHLLVTLHDRVIGSLQAADPVRLRLQAHVLAALVSTGEMERAEEIGRSLLKTTDDVEVRLVAVDSLRFALWRQGRIREARQVVEDALTREDLPATTRREMEAFLADALLFTGDVAGAWERSQRVIDEARRARDDTAIVTALSTGGWVCAARGEVSAAIELTAEALLRFPPPGRPQHAHLYHGVALLEADRLAEALSVLEDGERYWSARDPNSIPVYLYAKAGARFFTGDWDDALAELQTGLQMKAEGAGLATGSLFGYALAGQIALRRGDVDAAELFVAQGEAEAAARGPTLGIDFLWWTRALLLEAAGEIDRAYEAMAFAWDATAQLRFFLSWRSTSVDLVRMSRLVDHSIRGRTVAAEAEEGSRRSGGIASADAAALLCDGISKADPALLTRAVEKYRESPRRFEHGRAAELAASSLADVGDLAAARALFEEALSLYEGLRAARESSRVTARMRRAGIRRGTRTSRDRPPSGWDALTPTERKVVALAVEGLTNPQIADGLFISKRTVQTHLSHVFTKLGLSSRVELAAMTARANTRVRA